MQCLKCGRKTGGKDVFCPECLTVMAASPVRPDTPVTLPRRDKIAKRAPTRKKIKPEEHIARLQKSVRRLWVAVAVLCVLLIIVTGALVYRLLQPDTIPNLGQNYSTADSNLVPPVSD